jgi:hypothetical protein
MWLAKVDCLAVRTDYRNHLGPPESPQRIETCNDSILPGRNHLYVYCTLIAEQIEQQDLIYYPTLMLDFLQQC